MPPMYPHHNDDIWKLYEQIVPEKVKEYQTCTFAIVAEQTFEQKFKHLCDEIIHYQKWDYPSPKSYAKKWNRISPADMKKCFLQDLPPGGREYVHAVQKIDTYNSLSFWGKIIWKIKTFRNKL